MATDPVCGMTVAPEKAAATERYRDNQYFFCSAGCAAKFRADPAQYAGQREVQAGGKGDHSCCAHGAGARVRKSAPRR